MAVLNSYPNSSFVQKGSNPGLNQQSNIFPNKTSNVTILKLLFLLLIPLFTDGEKNYKSTIVFTFNDTVSPFDSQLILSSSKSKFTSLTEKKSQDFETFLRYFNRSSNLYQVHSEKTDDVEFIYHSHHDHNHNHNHDTLSKGRRVIILTGLPELFAVPYKNVSLYVVLRPLARRGRFSAHFAYVRNFTKPPSVEWDIYSLGYHNPNCSLISTFLPTIKGPEYDLITDEKEREREKRPRRRTFRPFYSSGQNNAEILTQRNTLKKRNLEVDGREEDLNGVTESDNFNETPVPISTINEYSLIGKLPFVGLGECPLVSLGWINDPISSVDHLVDFYLEVLRVQCEVNCKHQTGRLFVRDFVHKIDHLRVEINERDDLFGKIIMTEAEWTDFSSALVFAEFSKVYSKKYGEYFNMSNSSPLSSNSLSPDGKRISGSISTLTELVLNVLESGIKTPGIRHAIKIGNLLQTILQAERSDLVSREDDLEKCSLMRNSKNLCVGLLKENRNDQLQVDALMRFIIDQFGQGLLFSSEKSFDERFHSFYGTFLVKNIAIVVNKEPFLP